jgi:hypothetical protein
VGSSVPAVDWESFASDPASIPGECSDGSPALTERAPAVTLIDESYDVPRSWRASLDWSRTFSDAILVRVGGLASLDLSQPGTVDRNFAGVTRFALATEDDRPVFVPPSGIDAASGAVSAAQSRISAQFGRVNSRVSDLRGWGTLFTLGLSPDVFKFRSRFTFYSSAAYTLQWARRQYRGLAPPTPAMPAM